MMPAELADQEGSSPARCASASLASRCAGPLRASLGAIYGKERRKRPVRVRRLQAQERAPAEMTRLPASHANGALLLAYGQDIGFGQVFERGRAL